MAELYRLENGILIYPQNEQITPEVIHDAVYSGGVLGGAATGLTDYKAKMRMYLGDHDILHKPADAQRTGPDNRLVANIANYLVDTYNG